MGGHPRPRIKPLHRSAQQTQQSGDDAKAPIIFPPCGRLRIMGNESSTPFDVGTAPQPGPTWRGTDRGSHAGSSGRGCGRVSTGRGGAALTRRCHPPSATIQSPLDGQFARRSLVGMSKTPVYFVISSRGGVKTRGMDVVDVTSHSLTRSIQVRSNEFMAWR
jgi:hypothetical protein